MIILLDVDFEKDVFQVSNIIYFIIYLYIYTYVYSYFIFEKIYDVNLLIKNYEKNL